MKRILAGIITLLFMSANSCMAFSELYYFKNIKTTDIEPIVKEGINNYKFNIVKENPYYAVSEDGNDNAVIILQQSGDNMFYYYMSNDNTKINKYIVKAVKSRDIICEQSFNTGVISIYDNLAQGILSNAGAEKQYSFEDSQENYFTPAPPPEPKQQTVLKGYVAQLSAGTTIQAYLQNAINTAIASKGEQIVAVISSNVTYNGVVIFPQGSLIYGKLTTARSATYGSRNGRVVIDFNQIITPENKVYNISTEAIDFTVSNDGKFKASVGNAVQNAALGALAGLVFALLSDRNVGQAMAIGAGVGAGSSAIYSTAEKGVDAEIPSFTELEITLTKPLSVSISN